MLKLLNLSLGLKRNLDRNEEYWQWKHENNPFGRSLILLGFDGTKLVGVRPFMRWKFNWQGNNILAFKPVDSVTHPEMRRRGVFSQLTTAACKLAHEQQAEFIFNTPNNNSLPGYLKLGWQEVGTLPVMMKLLKPFSFSWNLIQSRLWNKDITDRHKYAAHAVDSLDKAESLFQSEQDLKSLGDILLKNSRSVTSTISTVKDIDFIRWRYTRHPQHVYYVNKHYSSGMLDGVAFYRINNRYNSIELMIDDIITISDRPDVVRSLLVNIIKQVPCDYIVAHTAKQSVIHSVMKQLNFRTVPRKGPRLVSKPVLADKMKKETLMELSNWNLCLGDVEGL